MRPFVRSWLTKTDRVWDHLVGRREQARRRTSLGVLSLEDRVVPASAPAYAVGAAPGERREVRLYDQAGSLIRTVLAYEESFAGGVHTALADLTGDGVPDVAAARAWGGGPLVKVFDGKSGDLVSSFLAYAPDFRGGGWVAAGDQNGDGVSEVITGAGVGGGPRVRVFSGQTGKVLQDFFAADPADRSGVAVGAAGAKAAGLVAVAAGAGGKQARRFDPQGKPADLFAGLAS